MTVYFAVEGGFANLRRSVTVRPDGTLTVTRGATTSSGRLEPAKVAEITAELDRSGLFDRDRDYPAPPGAADLQRYELRYRGATVVAYDTTVPPALSGVASLLDQLTFGQ